MFSIRQKTSHPAENARVAQVVSSDDLSALFENAQAWSRLETNETEWQRTRDLHVRTIDSKDVFALAELSADETIITGDIAVAQAGVDSENQHHGRVKKKLEIFLHEGAEVPSQVVGAGTRYYLDSEGKNTVRNTKGEKCGGFALMKDYSPDHQFTIRGIVIWVERDARKDEQLKVA